MENGSDSSVSKVTLLKNAAAWDRLAKAHDALASRSHAAAFLYSVAFETKESGPFSIAKILVTWD